MTVVASLSTEFTLYPKLLLKHEIHNVICRDLLASEAMKSSKVNQRLHPK